MLDELQKCMKLIKTFNIYFSFFSLGLSVALTGPCLLDLQYMVHTDTQHIAMVYTARSSGYLIGAIIGGIILDLVTSKQAVLMICNLLVGACMFGIPWCRSADILMGIMAFNGLILGAIETGGNVICLQLWGTDSNPVFQGLHFTYGLGGLLAPLIAAPFLENHEELSFADNSSNFEHPYFDPSFKFPSNNTNLTFSSTGIPKITYPFSIVGAVVLLVAACFVFVCIVSPTEENCSEEGKSDNSDKNFLWMFFVVAFTFVIFSLVAGVEIGFAQMLTTYAVKGKLHATIKKGSYITSAFWAAFSVGRLVSVFLAIKFRSIVLIIGDMCVVSVSALILLFLMPNEWALWLASIVFGLGIASLYAALYGWVGNFINISNKISASFTVGCTAGEMIFPLVIAYFIETIPEMFAFVTAASVVLTIVLLVILHCIFKTGNVREAKATECFTIETWEKHI